MTIAILDARELQNVIVYQGADLLGHLSLRAQNAASAAEASATFAESVAGPTYASTAAGLSATTDGQSFAVNNGDGTVTIYLNDGGSAVAQRTLFTTVFAASPGGAGAIGTTGGRTVQEFIDAPILNTDLERVDGPAGAPTATASGAGVLTGSYSYRVTFYTAAGETDPSQSSNTVTASSNSIAVSNIPVSGLAGVIGRRLYRVKAGAIDETLVYLVATIPNNTQTTFADNAPDGSLGSIAPYFNTTGGNVTINGEHFIKSSRSSLSIGYNSGQAGYASTYVGTAAGQNVTTGFRLTGFGVEALKGVTDGYEMSAFGIHALGKTTSGRWNNAFGYSALENLTTAENCSAFGHRTLVSVTTGSRNTAFGSTAGILVGTGSDNTLIGSETAFFLTSGTGNSCMGVNAGHKIDEGNFNTFVGYYSGSKATSSSNSALGSNSLLELTTGGANTAVGNTAGNSVTTGVGNTFIGASAGTNASQKPDAFLSTAIGFGAFNTRDKEIVIGANDADFIVIAGVSFTRTQIELLLASVSPE